MDPVPGRMSPPYSPYSTRNSDAENCGVWAPAADSGRSWVASVLSEATPSADSRTGAVGGRGPSDRNSPIRPVVGAGPAATGRPVGSGLVRSGSVPRTGWPGRIRPGIGAQSASRSTRPTGGSRAPGRPCVSWIPWIRIATRLGQLRSMHVGDPIGWSRPPKTTRTHHWCQHSLTAIVRATGLSYFAYFDHLPGVSAPIGYRPMTRSASRSIRRSTALNRKIRSVTWPMAVSGLMFTPSREK
jgi:hypothetical protein